MRAVTGTAEVLSEVYETEANVPSKAGSYDREEYRAITSGVPSDIRDGCHDYCVSTTTFSSHRLRTENFLDDRFSDNRVTLDPKAAEFWKRLRESG